MNEQNVRDEQEIKQTIEKFKEIITQPMYTKDERDLIANTFADNEELLMAIRKHFLQGELTEHEQGLLKGLVENKKLYTLLRKVLLPQIDTKAPLGQAVDLWVSIDTKDKSAEEAHLDMKARSILIEYLLDRFDELRGLQLESRHNLKDLIYNSQKSPQEAFIHLMARNTLLQHIDRLLNNLRQDAVQTKLKLSPQEMEERMKKDSSQ